ncbi:MAG TPA: hypothetical protein VGI87_14765 [Solirubrobacteraceae bacterium]|jgi:hypothetical protein
MDENTTRSCIQAHADAVVRGDMDHVVSDFKEELRPQVPEIGKQLPQPVTSAEVLGVEMGDDSSYATIKYTGPDKELTIRTQWQDVSGQPQIAGAEPLG